MQNNKPFPWKCANCGRKTVEPSVGAYSLTMEHDGRQYDVTIPDLEAPRCKVCGELVVDDAANRRISDAFRQQVGLLTPEQLRKNREALGMTQKEVAALLGIAEGTLSRWETGGQIQQRALDRLLRLFFGLSTVRSALSDHATMTELGASLSVGSVDSERATRISRLETVLGKMPKEKEAAAVDLLELILAPPKGA